MVYQPLRLPSPFGELPTTSPVGGSGTRLPFQTVGEPSTPLRTTQPQAGSPITHFAGFQDPVYQDVFEGDPLGRQGIFNALIPQGAMGNQLSFLQSLFEPTFNRYLGQLVQNPALRFTDFVTQNFNPQRELLRAPGQVSGSGFGGTTLFNLR